MHDFRVINWQTNPYSLEQIIGLYKGNKEILAKLIAGVVPVTDDRQRTEYFLLRQKFVQATRIQYVDDLWK